MNLDLGKLLESGPVTADHVAFAAAFAVFLSVLSVWRVLVDRSPAQRRIQALSARREALKLGLMTPRRRATRTKSVGIARRTVDALRLMRGKTAELAAKRLVCAGFRTSDAIVIFLFAKLCLPIGVGAAAAFLLYSLDVLQLGPPMKLLAAMAGVMVGFYAPDVVVKNATQKRQQALTKALPDTLDLMVICAEAGLSLDAMFARVAQEMQKSCKEMAEEIQLTGIELGFLPNRRQALENLHKRTGLNHLQALVSTLVQTEKYGTPLAQSLRVLARELRDERLMKAEEKAARLPATLMVPMVIFILPTLFIVLIGPGALRILDGLVGAFN